MTTAVDDLVIPDTPAGFEDMLADPKRMKAIYLDLAKGGEKFDAFVQQYAKHVLKRDTDIATQVRDEVQKGITSFLRTQQEEGFTPVAPINLDHERVSRTGPSMDARSANKAGLFNPRAMGAPLDSEFPSGPTGLAECLQMVWKAHKRSTSASDDVKLKRLRNAFSGDVPSDGGFLIPESLRSEVLRVALETSIVRSRARVIPMETLTVAFPAIDTTTNSGSVYGGITTTWAEAGSDLSLADSSPKFRRVQLHARKLIAFTKVDQELVADSIVSFLPFISEIFPEALAYEEDYAFLTGDGVGKPLGMLRTTNPAMVTVAAEAGQTRTSNAITWTNIVRMFPRMLPQSLNRAIWVVTPDAFHELATMALSVGTGGSAIWLTNGADAAPMTILGRPVLISEKTPGTLGYQGDISFVDPAFYLVGDRMAMSVSASEHADFDTDQIAYKVVERVDGRPWLSSAITPRNGGAAMSPFVQLATRPA
ncbi:MAG TPA: phage major capsid protein [Iamia sp.]